MYVGSLYAFPTRSKQKREHARYSLVPPIPSRSTSTTTALNTTDTPPQSPRPSSSSSISTSTVNTTANSSNVVTNAATATSTTSSATATKSPTSGVADNRAHRSSTHLHFIDQNINILNNISVNSGVNNATTSNAVSSATSSPALTAVPTFSSPNSGSTALSASAASALLASLPSTSARPEVAIHHYAPGSPYDPSSARWQQQPWQQREHTPATPVEIQKLDRDHPLVIKQRLKGLALTSVLVPVYLWWLFKFTDAVPSDQSFWTRLGQFLGLLGIAIPESIFKLANHIVIPLVLVGILFMGPILMMFLSNELPFQQAFDWASQRQHLWGMIGIRNFVAGPISEEFIFRSCMVAIVSKSGASSFTMIFALPLVFGIAHIHHGYESFVKKGRTRRALLNAALTACFQLVYTTLFGWFATFLFLRTSNVIAPCLCHAFCNMLGFPDVTNIQYFGRWKIWLYLAFAIGVVLFGVLLRPMTSPELYGNETNLAYWKITMGAVAPTSST
ncbi:hypothetical protein BGZ98_007356 [Dissophora globulifera]|nr:hypothetical protein BGZ98_007356 [Dissophora globulifera]